MNTNRLSNLSTLEEIHLEKRRIRRIINIEEKNVIEAVHEVYSSVTLLSSVTSIIKNVSSSLTLMKGIQLGVKMFSLLFRKKLR